MEAIARLGMMFAGIAACLLYISWGMPLAGTIPLLFVVAVVATPAAILTLIFLLPVERKLALDYGSLVYLAVPVISGLIGALSFTVFAGLRLDGTVAGGAMIYGLIGLAWGSVWIVTRAVYRGAANS